MKKTLDQFKNDVINQFTENITDRVFLMIQNDRPLMQQYMDLLAKHPRNSVNSSIAKAIKAKFKLSNMSDKIKNPETFLVKSFEKFEL